MRPYQHQRLIEGPDIGDIKQDGRASHVGKLPSKSGEYKSYTRSARSRRETRRMLKRADKQKLNRRLEREDQ